MSCVPRREDRAGVPGPLYPPSSGLPGVWTLQWRAKLCTLAAQLLFLSGAKNSLQSGRVQLRLGQSCEGDIQAGGDRSGQESCCLKQYNPGEMGDTPGETPKARQETSPKGDGRPPQGQTGNPHGRWEAPPKEGWETLSRADRKPPGEMGGPPRGDSRGDRRPPKGGWETPVRGDGRPPKKGWETLPRGGSPRADGRPQ